MQWRRRKNKCYKCNTLAYNTYLTYHTYYTYNTYTHNKKTYPLSGRFFILLALLQ